jgi:hypothetical protein
MIGTILNGINISLVLLSVGLLSTKFLGILGRFKQQEGVTELKTIQSLIMLGTFFWLIKCLAQLWI